MTSREGGDHVRKTHSPGDHNNNSPVGRTSIGKRSLSLPSDSLDSPEPRSFNNNTNRPPRSPQRSPTSTPTEFDHDHDSASPRRPSANSGSATSTPMKLTRSYNRRDLSESLEDSPTSRTSLTESISYSTTSGGRNSRSAPTSTTPSRQQSTSTTQGGSFSSPNRREFHPPNHVTIEPYQAFQDQDGPVSPSFIPPFQFDNTSSEPSFHHDNLSIPSLYEDSSSHSTRSPTSLLIPSITPPTTTTTTTSRSSGRNRTSRPTSMIKPTTEEDPDDSGSQYSIEVSTDSEPWGGLIVGEGEESPPPLAHSPLLTRESSTIPPPSSFNTKSIAGGGGEEEAVGLALLMKESKRRRSSINDSSTVDRTTRTEDWTRARSVPRNNDNNKEEEKVVVGVIPGPRRSSVGGEEQTWWKGGGLVVNGKKLTDGGGGEEVRYRRDDEPLVTAKRGSRSDSTKFNARNSGSSSPRRSTTDDTASALRTHYSNSGIPSPSRRSPSLINDPPLTSSSSRRSSTNASPSSSTFSPASTILGYSPSRPTNASNISEPYSRRISNSSISKGSAATAGAGGEMNYSPKSSMEGVGSTLLFGNLAKPNFVSSSPNPTTVRSLPSLEVSNHHGEGPSLITTQSRSSDSPSNGEDSSSSQITPPQSFTSPYTAQQTLTPGSSKSNKTPLPILRAKSSRRVSAGTLRRTTKDHHSSTIVEGREMMIDSDENNETELRRREDLMLTPQRDDSRELSEFSTPLSTSDFADAYFDQSPYRSDVETLYPDPTPSNNSNSTPYDPRESSSTTFRHPFRSSLEMNYPGQYPTSGSSPRTYDSLLDLNPTRRSSSSGRRPSTTSEVNGLFLDRRTSIDPLSTTAMPSAYIDHRRPSALSEVFSEDGDVYHDASGEEITIRSSWEIQRAISNLLDSTPPPPSTVIVPAVVVPVVGGGGRGDAKARAAAFVADLKRARNEATAAAGSSTTSSNNGLDSPVTSLFSAKAETPEPSFEDEFHSPLQLPQSTSSQQPSPLISEPMSPPPPPPPPRSDSPGVIPLASPTHSLPTGSYEQLPPSISIVAPSYPELDRLNRRRRPLPNCLQYSDVKKLKTPGHRAKMYATKINQLGNEDSGINVWVGFVRGQYNVKPSLPPSNNQTRNERVQASSASSIFPLRQDSYVAKEIQLGHFGPSDLTPTVPYPGVLLPLNARYSGTSLNLKTPSSLSSIGKSSNFFSGLGRKSSKRAPIGSPTPLLTTGTGSSNNLSSMGYIVNSPLGPLGIKSKSPSSSSLALRSGLNGPRNPGVGTTNNRSSMDSIASTNTMTSYGGQPSSFSYGTMRSVGEGIEGGDQEGGDQEERLNKLQDVLPNVDREVLREYLERCGGNEVDAISLYLEEEQRRRG